MTPETTTRTDNLATSPRDDLPQAFKVVSGTGGVWMFGRHAGAAAFMRAAALAICVGGTVMLGAFAGCGSTRPVQTETVIDPAQLPPAVEAAYRRLAEPTLGLAQRVEAASQLLAMPNDPDAARVVTFVLSPSRDSHWWRPMILAVASRTAPPPPYVATALENLPRHIDDWLAGDLATALSRIDDDRLVRRLTAMAQNPVAGPTARRVAVLALGRVRTQRTAQVLIDLTAPAEDPAVQAAAFDALALLSGIEDIGEDRYRWRQWWDQASRLSEEQWQSQLVENFADRQTQAGLTYQQLEDRLLDSQRALYRATLPQDRPAVLTHMLSDSLPAIRLLAMELSLQRLLDDMEFPPTLRVALRGRLTDERADIRERAALLLRDLADADAADIVARRLARGEETATAVVSAYLKLLTRLPRLAAVEPAYELLNDQVLRADAAGALAAAHDAQLLGDRLSQRSLRRVRRDLERHAVPEPQIVTLLGRIGEAEDYQLIARWIDSSDQKVKQAAAAAWAQSNRSLRLLAERAADPVISPIVIRAAQQRGDDPMTLRALAQHRPTSEHTVGAWEQALVAMAGRVPREAVLDTHLALNRQSAVSGLLLEQVLSAAIDRPADNTTPQTIARLHLERAQIRQSMDRLQLAVADYEAAAVNREELSPSQRERLDRQGIATLLAVGRIDSAFEWTRRLLGVDNGQVLPATDDPMIDLLIKHAGKLGESDKRDDALGMLSKLRLLLGPRIKPEVAQRIALLQAQLNGQTPQPEPEPQPGPAPTPPTPAPTPPPAPTGPLPEPAGGQ